MKSNDCFYDNDMSRLTEIFSEIRNMFEIKHEDENNNELIWRDRWYHLQKEVNLLQESILFDLKAAKKQDLTFNAIELEGFYRCCDSIINLMENIKNDEVI